MTQTSDGNRSDLLYDLRFALKDLREGVESAESSLAGDDLDGWEISLLDRRLKSVWETYRKVKNVSDTDGKNMGV